MHNHEKNLATLVFSSRERGLVLSHLVPTTITSIVMARQWSNLNIPGALHFVTGNIRDRDQIFQEECCCREFFATLSDLRNSWPAKLIAHVLMPDHFHLIANPRDGDIQGFTGTLKSKLSIQIIELTGDRFLLPRAKPDGSIHQV